MAPANSSTRSSALRFGHSIQFTLQQSICDDETPFSTVPYTYDRGLPRYDLPTTHLNQPALKLAGRSLCLGTL
jgi:hypothetical protein